MTNDYDSITVNGVGLVPYTGASQAVNLNNKAVSNVASLAVNGTTSSDTLTVTNNTDTGSLTSLPTTYPVANIKIDTSTTIFVVMIPYPVSFVVGATVQIYNFNTLPAFNRTYTITSVVLGSSLFYANYTSGLTVGDRYYTSTARAFITNGSTGSVSCMSLSSQISASLANLTATGTNSISNLTTTGTLATNGLTLAGTSYTEFGFGTSGKQANAGKIAYELFEAGFLGIVGAGTSIGTRNVKIYDNATIAGTLNVIGIPTVPTPATSDNSTQIATTAFVNNFAIPISGICTGVNTTLRLFNALTTAVFRITSPSGTNIFQVYYTSGVPEVICSSLQVTTSGEFRALGSCNLGATTCTTLTASSNVGITGTFNQTGTFTQTGQQTFNLGSYGSSGDYIVPPTNIYGSTIFDGFNGVNIQNQASQYGRNILFLTGRYEASNDAWSWNSPRNAIIFRTQATLNASASIRYTIQNYFQELGIMSAGKGSVPITKWANDGTMTHTDNMIVGGDFTSTKVSASIQFANQATFSAKNSGGTYENFLWPRWSDNITYLNFGTGGFHLRNNASATAMFITNACNVGIGHSSPICALDTVGIANIWTGSRFAVNNGYMSAGSLTLGSVSASYGGGTAGFNSSTAGLMFETNANTEIAVHHSGARVTSMIYYRGSNNTLLIGRDMGGGWGTATTSIEGQLNCQKSVLIASTKNIFWDSLSPDTTNAISWNGDGGAGYSIHRSAGAWSAPNYQQLVFNFHTGFVFTCEGQNYGKSYVDFQCTTRHTNGNNSIALYGPNSSWNSYLYVGASDNRISTSSEVAQVITTNGNLHLDAGYNRDMYLNYYNQNAVSGSVGAIRMYGSTITVPNIPAQNYYTANIAILGSSAELRTGQLQSFHFESRGAWGSGVSLGDFYKGSLSSAIVIRGDGSYYKSGSDNTAIIFRIYNTSNGVYYYYYYNQFTNVTYNHVSYPFNHFASNNTLPVGTYNVYMYLNGGAFITDGNDYISVTVTIHP
jgi:hypothetical protein